MVMGTRSIGKKKKKRGWDGLDITLILHRSSVTNEMI